MTVLFSEQLRATQPATEKLKKALADTVHRLWMHGKELSRLWILLHNVIKAFSHGAHRAFTTKLLILRGDFCACLTLTK